MPEAPTDNSPDRRARKWQVLSLSSGLLLASSFFMPAIQQCNAPVVPADDAYSALTQIGATNRPPSVKECSEFGIAFLLYFAAYSFGFLATCCAAARLARSHTWQWILSTGLMIWIVISCSLLLLIGAVEVKAYGLPAWAELWSIEGVWTWLTVLIVPILTLVYLPAAVRLRDRRILCWMFAGSCWATGWFGSWMVGVVWGGTTAYYGLYLSFAAACFLLFATLGEAVALTRQSWLRTFGQLLTCRLAGSPDMRGHCPGCDYYLYGLTEQRCPECGRPFTFEELKATPAELGFEPQT